MRSDLRRGGNREGEVVLLFAFFALLFGGLISMFFSWKSHVSSYKPSGPTHFFLFHLNQATKKNINSLSKLIIIKMNKLLHCIKPRLSGLQPTSTSLGIPFFTPIKQKILTRYSRDYLNIKQNMSLKVLLHIPIFYTNHATAKHN